MLLPEQIKQIVDNHQLWLQTYEAEGKCADFSNEELSGYRFENVNLSFAKFDNACLNDTKFVHTTLHHTSFYKAYLRRVFIRYCDINHANFKFAGMNNACIEYSYIYQSNFLACDLKLSDHWTVNYTSCDFKDALLSFSTFKYCYMHDCNLSDVASINVRYLNSVLETLDCTNVNFTKSEFKNSTIANLAMKSAKLDDIDIEYANFVNKHLKECFNHTQSDDKSTFGTILKEPLTGYKKTRENVVITVEIPKGAVVFSINGSKCRTNKAKIIDMRGYEQLTSIYDSDVKYHLNEEFEIENFDMRYNVECGPGFHFFKTKTEAEAYGVR